MEIDSTTNALAQNRFLSLFSRNSLSAPFVQSSQNANRLCCCRRIHRLAKQSQTANIIIIYKTRAHCLPAHSPCFARLITHAVHSTYTKLDFVCVQNNHTLILILRFSGEQYWLCRGVAQAQNSSGAGHGDAIVFSRPQVCALFSLHLFLSLPCLASHSAFSIIFQIEWAPLNCGIRFHYLIRWSPPPITMFDHKFK